jgi:hypothetical protein
MVRTLTNLAALSLILGSGFVSGLWTNRWGSSQELKTAADRLQHVPTAFGDWTGQAMVLDPQEVRDSDIEGYLAWRYVNRIDGGNVLVLLICGLPGPVAVHTPDVCYPGAGYEQSGPIVTESLDFGRSGDVAELNTALFRKDRASASLPLRVSWSWNAKGRWRVPANPRLSFAPNASLYKLYVVREMQSTDDQHEKESSRIFLRQFLPELQKALFAGSKSQ